MVPSHRKVRSGRDEFRETLTAKADGNPEPSRRYTAGRCRDYLSASVALNDRLERPAPAMGEEIVHSFRKRRGRSESLGPRFESERAHYFTFSRPSLEVPNWPKNPRFLDVFALLRYDGIARHIR